MSPTAQASLVAELEQLQGEMRQSVSMNDRVKLRLANKQFHFALYEEAESPRLVRMIENLWATFPWDVITLVPGRPANSLQEHDRIIDAVRAGDHERAREAAVQHIDASAQTLLKSEGTLGLSIFEDETT